MPAPSKKTLIDRWRDRSSPYGTILDDIETLLNEPSNETLRRLLPEIDGRLDLRGIDLSDLRLEKSISFSGAYRSIDFSHAQIESYVCFDRSVFVDCVFDHAKLLHALFWGSRFERCRFAKTLINTAFGDTRERNPEPTKKKGPVRHYADEGGYDYERMDGCTFIQAKFQKYSNFAAINTNCVYDRCEIRSGYIHGAFENCRFIGKLRDNIFLGYQTDDRPYGENTLVNTMRGVDFSACELTFMCFYQACDLSQIVPPDSSTHCIYPATLAFAREVERIGRERGMDSRYPASGYPSFASSMIALHKDCGADLDFMIRIDPEREAMYREDVDFERGTKFGETRYGLITPRDYFKTEDYQRELFEVYVAAQQRIADDDTA
jgi:uncharacterized protein YjbI with pentapeptide repeats